MEVRIGVQHVARELVIESPEDTDAITTAVSARNPLPVTFTSSPALYL